jgi:hypothetical protein
MSNSITRITDVCLCTNENCPLVCARKPHYYNKIIKSNVCSCYSEARFEFSTYTSHSGHLSHTCLHQIHPYNQKL